jgi:hypothetical protein
MDMFEIPAMAAQPIGGSFAWTVPQVWARRLDLPAGRGRRRRNRRSGAADADARSCDQDIGRDDFPLGRLTTRLGALRAQIRSGLGFGYIKACRSSATIARR